MKIKDWKSGMLCSAAFWALDPRINPTYTTRDPTRKPCVLYVTGENDMMETIERMLSNKLGSDVELRGSDPDEMVRRMEEAFSSEHCEFVFKYRASGSITTADLEVMMQELHTAGREVIMVVQDYIKRIKPVQESSDQRHLELGYVVDEFSSMNFVAYHSDVVVKTSLTDWDALKRCALQRGRKRRA